MLRAADDERRKLSRVLKWAALAAEVWLLSLCFGVFAGSAEVGSSLTVVARNLNNPRGIFVAKDGAIYVAEAGTGGHDRCVSTKPLTCVGLSGSITEIDGTKRRRVVTGLVSIAHRDGQRAAGPAAVLVRDGVYYVLLQDAFVESSGANVLGKDGKTAGTLISSAPGVAAPKVIADLSRFEAHNNPDRGAGPGTTFGNPSIDSDPYAFVAYRGGFAVADAAANDVLWIAPSGALSVLAVFPTRVEKLTLAERRRFGAPTSQRSIVTQAVPSSLAVGSDGALYVGELTGVPFKAGTARIWRVLPGKKMSLYASRFTNISALAFDGPDLLVLEIAARGLTDTHSPGALIRLTPNGKRTVLASAGLSSPTGVAVYGHDIYISNYGTSSGSGPGSRGELVRLHD